MDGLALNNLQQRNGKTLNFVNHTRFLYCGVRPRAQLHYIRLATRAGRESNVPRFPELWWPAPATVDTAESRLTSGDTSSGHKPGFPAKTYAHQVTHPPTLHCFEPHLAYSSLLYICWYVSEPLQILIESTLIRTSWNDILAQKWCTSESTQTPNLGNKIWCRILDSATRVSHFLGPENWHFCCFLKSMNETLTQNQNMTTAILVCYKFHLILRWLYITLNTNITIFK